MSVRSEATTSATIRQHNAAAVLQALWESGAMSRSDLADRIGVTRPALTRISQELAAAGYLEISAAVTIPGSRGRPGDSVELAAGKHLCIGADLRLDRGRMRGVDLRGNVIFDEPVVVRSDSPTLFMDDIVGQATALAARHVRPISALGISGPIRVSPDGRLITWPMRNWTDEPIADPLAASLGLPPSRVAIGNIAGCAALANWRELAGGEEHRLAHVQVGLGAGLGLADRSGRLSVTTRHIEHLPLAPGGALCHCGVYGCVYAMVGFEALTAIARPGYRLEPDDDIYALSAQIGREAAAGESPASEAVEHVALWLGQLAGIADNVFSPTVFTLGGYPAFIGEAFTERFRYHFRRAVGAPINLRQTVWGDDAATQGVALLAVRALLDSPRASD